MKNDMKKILIAAIFAMMVQPMQAIAQDADNSITMELEEAVDTLAFELDDSFDMAAESDSTLDEIRGTFGGGFTAETVGIAELTAISQGNITNGGVTGDNSISDNAFSNTAGLSFVVQNSGNNVAINANMVVNVSLTQ